MIPRNKKNKHQYSFILRLMIFCGALIFSFTPTQAQESLNASNSIHILANQLDVQAYPNGTFDADKVFLALVTEMDKMNNDFSRGLQYRYYWLVSVDIKRNGLPLEESLLKNLNKAGNEFGVPNSTLKKLYSKTIALF
ncbi:MAG: hypothetical protein AB8H03_03040 [Saprospiraceae bacterium]